MNTKEMIAVLEAYERGEKIEWSDTEGKYWQLCRATPVWNFSVNSYRIAPKEMTLVEELRQAAKGWENVHEGKLMHRSADRIEELEQINPVGLEYATTDELISEIKRRLIDKC